MKKERFSLKKILLNKMEFMFEQNKKVHQRLLAVSPSPPLICLFFTHFFSYYFKWAFKIFEKCCKNFLFFHTHTRSSLLSFFSSHSNCVSKKNYSKNKQNFLKQVQLFFCSICVDFFSLSYLLKSNE